MSSVRKVVAEYVGEAGEFFHGIPARDLTAEDVDALTPEQLGLLHSGSIYKLHGTQVKADAKDAAVESGLVEPEPEEKSTRNDSESKAETPAPKAQSAARPTSDDGKAEASRATTTKGGSD